MTTIEVPARIQLSRAKDWRKPPDAITIRRPTIWRNPFIIGKHGTRAQCIARHALLALGFIDMGTQHVDQIEQELLARHMRDHAQDLRGKTLACTCRTCDPCHGDTLHLRANGNYAALQALVESANLRPAIYTHIDDLDQMAEKAAS